MESVLQSLEKYNDDKLDLTITGTYNTVTASKLLIKPLGNLETYNSNMFLKAVTNTLRQHKQIKSVIIDFTEVKYMSSTGIGVLIQILSFAKNNEVKLNCININDKIKTSIKLLGFTGFL